MKVKTCICKHRTDMFRFVSLTQCPCVLLCNLTTCYSNEGACFKRLNLKYDKLL